MIDIDCHACSMRITHHQHDKQLRPTNRSKYTMRQIECDYDSLNRNKRVYQDTLKIIKTTKIHPTSIKSTKKTKSIEVKIKNKEGVIVINSYKKYGPSSTSGICSES